MVQICFGTNWFQPFSIPASTINLECQNFGYSMLFLMQLQDISTPRLPGRSQLYGHCRGHLAADPQVLQISLGILAGLARADHPRALEATRGRHRFVRFRYLRPPLMETPNQFRPLTKHELVQLSTISGGLLLLDLHVFLPAPGA